MKLIEQPITGKEVVSNESSPYAALVNFYSAFNNQNFDQMRLNWLQSEQASMANPLGGIKRSWNEIEAVYKKIFSGEASVYVEFYDYTISVTDTMFFAIGRERGFLEINNSKTVLAIRTTRIYTLHENRWRQSHHHGSMDNPELLLTYQRTLLEN